MYIANTTTQNLRLNLRVPESKKALVYDIPSGQQIAVGGDWTAAQTSVVVNYLDTFGARALPDLSGKLRGFNGILYSLDRPVPVDGIEAGHGAVVDHQTEVASDEITKAALGVDRAARDPKTRRRKFKRTTLEVTQVTPPGESATDGAVRFGVTVDPEGHDDPGLNA